MLSLSTATLGLRPAKRRGRLTTGLITRGDLRFHGHPMGDNRSRRQWNHTRDLHRSAEPDNGLQAVYILFALAAQAGFGAALLQTGLVSSGVSWFTLVWSLGWLFVLALGIPAILMIAPAAIGVALLST